MMMSWAGQVRRVLRSYRLWTVLGGLVLTWLAWFSLLGYLPVTVYTQEAMSLAQQKAKHINTVFYGVYAAEAVAALAIYLRKREK